MNTKISVLTFKSWIKEINWPLLIFLLLFLNVKLVIKLAAILFIYVLQPNFKAGFKWKASRLPLFYPAVCVIAFINLVVYNYIINVHYDIAFLVGLLQWLLCILAIHQLKIFVDKTDPQIIYHTLIAFFIINAFASLAEIAKIIIETGALNPYRYQGQYQKYFISTGDYIKGITLDTSTTNAALNAFGITLFLFKRNMLMVLLCMATLLLTASNFVNIILFSTLIYLLIFKSDKNQKSIIVVCFLFTAVFLGKVSPQNVQYIRETFEKITRKKVADAVHIPVKEIPITEKPDSILNPEQRKEKIATLYLDSIRKVIYQNYVTQKKEKQPAYILASSIGWKLEIPQPSIHTPPFQHRDDTNTIRKELLQFISYHPEVKTALATNYNQTALPGKVVAFKQTVHYLHQYPVKIISGNGMGNFASKLAFKTTALHFAGGYPEKYAYINPDFCNNHLDLYLFFFSQQASKHSITNSHNSVYDQLLAEYGILGIAAFFVLYIGYFLKGYKRLTYGMPLLLLLLGFFFIDYWFEQLSIVILFELLLLLNQKETSVNTAL